MKGYDETLDLMLESGRRDDPTFDLASAMVAIDAYLYDGVTINDIHAQLSNELFATQRGKELER